MEPQSREEPRPLQQVFRKAGEGCSGLAVAVLCGPGTSTWPECRGNWKQPSSPAQIICTPALGGVYHRLLVRFPGTQGARSALHVPPAGSQRRREEGPCPWRAVTGLWKQPQNCSPAQHSARQSAWLLLPAPLPHMEIILGLIKDPGSCFKL